MGTCLEWEITIPRILTMSDLLHAWTSWFLRGVGGSLGTILDMLVKKGHSQNVITCHPLNGRKKFLSSSIKDGIIKASTFISIHFSLTLYPCSISAMNHHYPVRDLAMWPVTISCHLSNDLNCSSPKHICFDLKYCFHSSCMLYPIVWKFCRHLAFIMWQDVYKSKN
jgi:hypothetical protein